MKPDREPALCKIVAALAASAAKSSRRFDPFAQALLRLARLALHCAAQRAYKASQSPVQLAQANS